MEEEGLEGFWVDQSALAYLPSISTDPPQCRQGVSADESLIEFHHGNVLLALWARYPPCKFCWVVGAVCFQPVTTCTHPDIHFYVVHPHLMRRLAGLHENK